MRDEQRGEDHQASVAGIDEWDQDFLNEVIQIELEAISSRNFASTQSEQAPFPTSTNPDPTFPPFPINGFPSGGADGIWGFSPPRELSQRPPPERPEPSQLTEVFEIKEPRGLRNDGPIARGGARKDREVDRLKRDLTRVSMQLNHLEHECKELKKERDKKDEQLKCAFSQIESKDAEIHSLIREKLEASKQDHSQSTWQLPNTGAYPVQFGHCPVSEDKCLWSNPHVLERITRGSNDKSKGAIEPSRELSLNIQCNGPKRKDVQSDGIYEVSELKRLKMSENNLTTSGGCSVLEYTSHEISAQLKCTKTIGIQTELGQAHSLSALKDILSVECNISSKLLAIWGSPICGSADNKRIGRDLVSKLFVTCSADFCVLFSCMSMGSKIDLVSKTNKSFSDVALHDGTPSVRSIDAAKVSQLYALLMKMHNEMAQLPAFLEALLELCTVENVSVVYRSLRILHAILQHFSSCDIRSDRRNNVLVDQSLENTHENKGSGGLQNQIGGTHVYDKAHNGTEASGLFSLKIRSFDMENLFKDENGSSSFSSEKLVLLFETMRQIVLRESEEYIRIEATSIMNLILMRSNPNKEREKFGLMPLLQIVSHLVREEVGWRVRLQAVRLLFLLLNCPKMLMMFCSGGKDGTEVTGITDVQKDASTLQKDITGVLNGLSECLACGGAGAQVLRLRRQVIILLAYIATHGKSGFEILANTPTPQGFSFLESIVRVLASEMDVEAADFAQAQALCKERSSLLREALILLNRLASHPAHSKATLGALTRANATASLTVDVANRLSQKSRGRGKCGGGGGITKKTQMELEIVDLARLFRTRVFAFLGEIAS